MIYVCDVCKIKAIKTKSGWIQHLETEKHKKNSLNATHTCCNCNSCFIYNKNSITYKNKFETHMEECNELIIDKTKDNSLYQIENEKLINEINTLKKTIDNLNENKKEIEIFKKEKTKLKEEINKLKEENIQLKGEIKFINKLEKENQKLENENEN